MSVSPLQLGTANYDPHAGQIPTQTFPQENDEKKIICGTLFEEFKTLGCPFSGDGLNPYHEAVNQATLDWSTQFNIPFSPKNQFTQLISGAHPHCNLEILSTITFWVTMLFHYDDKVETILYKTPEKLRDFNERNLKILRKELEATSDDDPLTKAIEDLRKRFEKISSPQWIERFIMNVEEHFKAIYWESTKESIPEFNLYQKMRPFTSALYLMFDFCELAEGITISDEVYSSDYFKQLRLHCNNAVWMPNDIISFPKEDKDSGNNMIHIFMQKELCSFPDAVKKAKWYCEDEFNQTLSFIKKMPHEYGEKEKKYINGLCYWIWSNYSWSLLTERYQQPSAAQYPLYWKKI